MTEASENGCLVRVRAQVMCRDEGTGGWVALGGGGLADVMVGRRGRQLPAVTCDSNGDAATAVPAVAPPHDYFIHGKRISDNMVVLECTIKKDFQYNKVMPTFHHWVTDEKRFGLTFQTAADARAFDKGVRSAIEELLDGLGGAWPSLHAYKKLNPAPHEDDEEQNIFECLNLPSESRSSSETSSASRRRPELSQTPILSAITLPQRHPTESMAQYDEKSLDDSDPDRCPYVHLSAIHEYTYPGSGADIGTDKPSPGKPPLLKRDSGSIKIMHSYSGPPPLPGKKATEQFHSRLKCRHCHEWYLECNNRAGACEYAPDPCRRCIDTVSCLQCAQCMVYHCMADSEGDPPACSCRPCDLHTVKRWIAIGLLSLLVPCLWCYLPLRCAHRGLRRAGLAGRTHAPAASAALPAPAAPQSAAPQPAAPQTAAPPVLPPRPRPQ